MHAGVLGCKETEAAKPDSHSILDYMPGEQPSDGGLFSQARQKFNCHLTAQTLLLLPVSEALAQHSTMFRERISLCAMPEPLNS